MSLKSTKITLGTILNDYKKDFSTDNVLKTIHKNRLKFLLLIVLMILFIVYEGASALYDYPGRQAKKMADEIRNSLNEFTKKDLLDIFDKLSEHKNGDLKKFVGGLAESIKSGEKISDNMLAMKQLNPVENRSAEDVEKARNDFIDKMISEANKKLAWIDLKLALFYPALKTANWTGMTIDKLLNWAVKMYAKNPNYVENPKNEENQKNKTNSGCGGYDADMNNVRKHVNSNMSLLNYNYNYITEDKITDKCELDVINLLFMCYEIKKKNPHSDINNGIIKNSSWFDFCFNLLSQMLGAVPIYTDNDDTLTLHIKKYNVIMRHKCNRENLDLCEKYKKEIIDIQEHINNNSKDVIFPEDQELPDIKDPCIKKIINLLFKCYVIKNNPKKNYTSFSRDTKGLKDTWTNYCKELLKKMLPEKNIRYEEDDINKKFEVWIDNVHSEVKYGFGRTQKKRTSKKRTSKKRTSKKRTSKKRTSKKIKKL